MPRHSPCSGPDDAGRALPLAAYPGAYAVKIVLRWGCCSSSAAPTRRPGLAVRAGRRRRLWARAAFRLDLRGPAHAPFPVSGQPGGLTTRSGEIPNPGRPALAFLFRPLFRAGRGRADRRRAVLPVVPAALRDGPGRFPRVPPGDVLRRWRWPSTSSCSPCRTRNGWRRRSSPWRCACCCGGRGTCSPASWRMGRRTCCWGSTSSTRGSGNIGSAIEGFGLAPPLTTTKEPQ